MTIIGSGISKGILVPDTGVVEIPDSIQGSRITRIASGIFDRGDLLYGNDSVYHGFTPSWPWTINAGPSFDHTATGPQTNILLSGATITAMSLVYLGPGGKWFLSDADDINTTFGFMGIALESKNNGEVINVGLPGCFVRDESWNWATPGATLYADTVTPGGSVDVQPSGTDDAIRIIGWVVTASTIFFSPSADVITHI